MKLKAIKQLEGECCRIDLVKGQVNEKLHCIICYQVMTKPVTLCCASGHTFGMACIKEWIKDRENILCPYCRGPASNWTVTKQIEDQLIKLQGVCNYCNEWKGSLSKLEAHRCSCLKYYEFLQKQLNKVIQQQIAVLNLEINPHLKQCHAQIYNKYVQDWTWLTSDMRDWKWWWWCSNPWWNKIPCITCNKLWHKHLNKIDLFQAQRINILELINHNFVQVSIKNLFPQQKQQEMKSENNKQV